MKEHSKRRSATKSGPGRYHGGGEPGSRLTKPRAVRSYVALMAAWASKRVTKAPMRDEHGAYTVVGRPLYAADAINADHGRRKWLAGISAQRGF